jgi:hypothetical protein
MGNSLLDVCVFGRRAGVSASAWASAVQPAAPTLAHVNMWMRARLEAGLLDDASSPVILPDYTRKGSLSQPPSKDRVEPQLEPA